MKRAANTPARSRPRKKAAAPEPVSSVASETDAASATPAELSAGRNVGSLEGTLSVGMGVLFILAAVFPRSLRQLLMLSLGGGLLYRGMTGHCGLYQAVGIDTVKGPLLEQINARLGSR